MKTYLIIGGIVLAGVILVFSLSGDKSQQLKGYLVSTITNASSSVGMSDTLVYTPSNLQFLRVSNIGAGKISCGFNTTSTLTAAASAINQGLIINPTGSSTLTSFETVDYNLLGKYMHCVADATSTLSILRF